MLRRNHDEGREICVRQDLVHARQMVAAMSLVHGPRHQGKKGGQDKRLHSPQRLIPGEILWGFEPFRKQLKSFRDLQTQQKNIKTASFFAKNFYKIVTLQ